MLLFVILNIENPWFSTLHYQGSPEAGTTNVLTLGSATIQRCGPLLLVAFMSANYWWDPLNFGNLQTWFGNKIGKCAVRQVILLMAEILHQLRLVMVGGSSHYLQEFIHPSYGRISCHKKWALGIGLMETKQSIYCIWWVNWFRPWGDTFNLYVGNVKKKKHWLFMGFIGDYTRQFFQGL